MHSESDPTNQLETSDGYTIFSSIESLSSDERYKASSENIRFRESLDLKVKEIREWLDSLTPSERKDLGL